MSEHKIIVLPSSEKLDSSGSNWIEWRGSIVSAAKAMRIKGYLDGTILKPADPSISVTVTSPNGSSTSAASLRPAKSHPSSSTPSITEWEDRDAVACAMIWQNVKTPVSLGLRDSDTAAEAWGKLVT
ncbi:hypothetical protein BOTBODRAFT_121925, partial [Botryobasidium botryosum FD-172 SS1]